MPHENIELLLQSHTETEEKQQQSRASSPLNRSVRREQSITSGQRLAAGLGGLATPLAVLLNVHMCAEASLGEELANTTLKEASGINGLC